MNTTYFIPNNFTDAGRIMGLFEIRNLIETVLLVAPTLYACVLWIPFALTQKIIATMIIIVPLGGFGLIGISDDSLGRWLSGWLQWRKGRRMMFYRGEVAR